MAANKATKIELFGPNNDGKPISFTHAASTAASKGDLFYLSSDPRTVAVTTTTSSGAIFAGVAAEDKKADDTATRITLWQDGIFDMTASGAITLGDKVILANGANHVQSATVNGSAATTGVVVGTCLETASDGEVVAIDTTRR